MDSGEVDESMRRAFITPIYKGGDRALAVNYRPVALSTHLTKTMERVIRGPIVEFLEATNQLDQSQHGARSGRSTLTQLLVHYNTVLRMIESENKCELIYLDFAKAFNKVDHSILITKLAKMGIKGPLGKWIGKFLLLRTQAVCVGFFTSEWLHVVSGVPQGTVLGPLLFLCYIADLGVDLGPDSKALLKYVDDTKVVKETSSMDDIEALQDDLETLYKWQASNNMEWNSTKFQSLRMGYNHTLRNESLLFTPEFADPIPELEVVKDLGVYMARDGTFSYQRSVTNKKAHQKAGWCLRTFKSRDLSTLKTLWSSLIRPHHAYCS
jgi:ribonuclease P/MRP protein subunit RPP40